MVSQSLYSLNRRCHLIALIIQSPPILSKNGQIISLTLYQTIFGEKDVVDFYVPMNYMSIMQILYCQANLYKPFHNLTI